MKTPDSKQPSIDKQAEVIAQKVVEKEAEAKAQSKFSPGRNQGQTIDLTGSAQWNARMDRKFIYFLASGFIALLVIAAFQSLDMRYVRTGVFKDGLDNLEHKTLEKIDRIQFESKANNDQVKDKLNELSDQSKEMRTDLKAILMNTNSKK